jgi:RNA polymerase sigma-70 factor, ECF subfamily
MKANQATIHDSVLIAKAAAGDEQAFTHLAKRYEETIYRFAFNVCRDKEKATETVQDTFINVFRKLNQYDGNAKFSTWLYSIVVNNCLMNRRQRKIDQASASIDGDDNGSINDASPVLAWDETPSEKLLNAELKQLLDEAIVKLPLEYRIVFILRDLEGQTAEEVATILRLSIPAVKSRLRRARIFLRSQLQTYMEQ